MKAHPASIYPFPLVSIIYPCLGLLCLVSVSDSICLVISLSLYLADLFILFFNLPLHPEANHFTTLSQRSLINKTRIITQPLKVRLGIKCDIICETFLCITNYHTNVKDYCYLAISPSLVQWFFF